MELIDVLLRVHLLFSRKILYTIGVIIMDKNIKVVYMGTPDFAVPALEMLISKTNVVLVVTQPDKETGRKKELTMSPVKKIALANKIPVFQPSKIRNDFTLIEEIQPDLIVTCAYGQILPPELLAIPRLGAINIHASLLPKYRGSAPIQWALLNGEEKTGITLMYMDAGMDTGDIIDTVEYAIKPTDNCGSLHDILAKLGAELLAKNLPLIIKKEAPRKKQDDKMASLAPRIMREDEQIDLNDQGQNIINKIRAFNPWPLAYLKTAFYEFKVLEADFIPQKNIKVGQVFLTKTSLGIGVIDGIIYFTKIKPLGKKEMDIKSYLNGLKR